MTMSDGQMLLAVFAAFYVIECIHWLPASAVVLRTFLLRRGWHVARPLALTQSAREGASFAWPLPLLGGFLLVDEWPVLPDHGGLWVGEGQPGAGSWVDWGDVRPACEQSLVNVTASLRVRCTTKQAARELCAFLQAACDGDTGRRSELVLAWWRQSLSLPRARMAVRHWLLAARALRTPCMGVFVLCFLWLPLLYWMHSTDGWRLLLGGLTLLATTALVAFTWRTLDRRIFRSRHRRRWPQALHLMFMPMHAMRAHDLIGAEILSGHHALPAAACVLSKPELRRFASAIWRRWVYRGPGDPLREASAVVVPRLRECCARLHLLEADLEASPQAQAGSLSYCPSCHAQFTVREATCPDCHGLETKGYEAGTK